MELPRTESSRPARETVPVRQKLFWGVGGIADTMIMQGLNGLVDQIYMIGLALDPKWVSLARAVPRFLDIVIDPILGHLSDNTRTRWGRRKPWMAAGAVIASAIAVLMWYPPLAMGALAVNCFVVGMLTLLFTLGYSLYSIPHMAMGFAMSTDSDERTRLFTYRLIAATAAMLLTPWLAHWCLEIEGERAALMKGIEGVRWIGAGVGGVILLTALVPVFFCKDVERGVRQPIIPFGMALKMTMGNKAFFPLILGNFLMRAGMCVSGILFYYVFIYRIGTDMKAGTSAWASFATTITIATLLGTPLVAWLSQRWGKKPTTLVLMSLSAVAYGSMWWTFAPAPLSLPLYYVTAVGIGLFCNTLPMVFNSMLADVCDVDELRSGGRREAFYGAVYVTSDKIAHAVALLLQGFLLESSGFDANQSHQSAATVGSWMLWLIATQPTGFLLGMCCILGYPLTTKRMAEIRTALDSRASR